MTVVPQRPDCMEVESSGSQGSLGRAQGTNYLLVIHMEVFHCSNKRNSHFYGCKLLPGTCACTKFPLQSNSERARAFCDLKGSWELVHCPRLLLGTISIIWLRIWLMNDSHQMNKAYKLYGHGSKMKLASLFPHTFLKYCSWLLTFSVSHLVGMQQE